MEKMKWAILIYYTSIYLDGLMIIMKNFNQ
jgi:hypothetical protein